MSLQVPPSIIFSVTDQWVRGEVRTTLQISFAPCIFACMPYVYLTHEEDVERSGCSHSLNSSVKLNQNAVRGRVLFPVLALSSSSSHSSFLLLNLCKVPFKHSYTKILKEIELSGHCFVSLHAPNVQRKVPKKNKTQEMDVLNHA